MIEDSSLDEFFHLQAEQAASQVRGLKSAYIGYIVSWDRDTNTVIVTNELAGAVPGAVQQLNQEGNTTGTPLFSAPLPLCTSFAGISNPLGINPINPGVVPGIVLAPFGGASAVHPKNGEQVLVLNINNEIGYAACALMLFNDVAISPAKSIPVTGVPLQPGEWLFVNPSGSSLHIANDGTATFYTVNVPGSAAGGKMNIHADGDITLGSNSNMSVGLDKDFILLAQNISEIANDAITLTATGGDAAISSGNDIAISAKKQIAINAQQETITVTSKLGQTYQSTDDTFSIEAKKDISISSDDEGIGIAAKKDLGLFGENVYAVGHTSVGITANTATVDIAAGTDVTMRANHDVIINPNNNLTAVAGAGVHVTAHNDLILDNDTFSSSGIQINSKKDLATTSKEDTLITATKGIQLKSTNNDINILSGADMLLKALNELGMQSTTGGNYLVLKADQTTELHSVGKLSLTSPSGEIDVTTANNDIKISTTGPGHIDISGQNQVNINGGTFLQTSSGQSAISASILNLAASIDSFITSGRHIQMVGTNGAITAAAKTGVSISTTGGPIGIRASSTASVDAPGGVAMGNLTAGPSPTAIVLAAILTIFNNHTHGGVLAGGSNTTSPNSTMSPGYPNTTDATFAN